MVDPANMDAGTGPGDGCLEKETRFGAYSFVLRNGSNLGEPVREGLGLTGEDLYIEVHVPDSVTGSATAVLGAFRDGVVELADFLIKKRLRPKCLIGVTHENVAKPARRFLNFQVFSGVPDEALDPEKANRIDEGYGKTKRAEDGIPRGPICLCYQSYESFMAFTEKLRSQHGRRSPGAGFA